MTKPQTPQFPMLPEPIWRVGLCASSSRPHDQIPCLARSEREIASMEKHESFIRWLSPRSDGLRAALEAQKAAAPELVGLSDEQILPMFRARNDIHTIGTKDSWYWYAWGVSDGERAHGITPPATGKEAEL